MNLEKLKQAEIVNGDKLDYPDDTFGEQLAGSELSITVEGECFKAQVMASNADYLARAASVIAALMDTEPPVEKEVTDRRRK